MQNTRKLILTSILITSINVFAMSNSKVLPKGVRAVSFSYQYIGNVSSKYDENGSLVRYDSPYNLELSAKTLAQYEPRLNELVATINELTGDRREGDKLTAGTSKVIMEGYRKTEEFSINYGLTSKVSLAMILPVITTKIYVDGSIEGKNTGKELMAQYPKQEELSAALKEFSDLSSETFLKYLREKGYDSNLNYDSTSIGDLMTGAKYQYFENSHFGFALGSAIIAPTGGKSNPDKLVEAPSGNGSWGMGLASYNDYYVTKWYNANLTLQYQKLLPNKQEMRVPLQNETLTSNKETVNRQYGDSFRFISSNTFNLTKNIYSDLSYIYSHHERDSYTRFNGDHVNSLESKTNISLHEGEVLLGYSTVPNYKKGNLTPPFQVELAFRSPLKGENVTYAKTVILNMWLYF